MNANDTHSVWAGRCSFWPRLERAAVPLRQGRADPRADSPLMSTLLLFFRIKFNRLRVNKSARRADEQTESYDNRGQEVALVHAHVKDVHVSA